MNTKRTIILSVCLIALLFSLVACGNDCNGKKVYASPEEAGKCLIQNQPAQQQQVLQGTSEIVEQWEKGQQGQSPAELKAACLKMHEARGEKPDCQ